MATIAQQAKTQLDPTFNTAVTGIQGQMPAIQQLYATLVQGLQQQNVAQTQNVVQSAEQRGVGRVGLEQDVIGALASSLMGGQAQLGLQTAQDTAVLGQQVGKTNVARAQGIQGLSDTLTSQDLAKKENALKLTQLSQNASLEMKKNQQDFNLRKITFEKQQAEAAARAAASSARASAPTASQALDAIGILWKPGGDGYVNPEQWNRYRKAYIDAGYSSSSFKEQYGYLVNPVHQTHGNPYKLTRYAGVALKD